MHALLWSVHFSVNTLLSWAVLVANLLSNLDIKLRDIVQNAFQ